MSAPDSSTGQTACANCTTHECGLLYAECPCCAARAAEPGDVTLGAAATAILDSAPDDDPLALADYIPYEGKTAREVIDDYVLVRGDLVDRDDPYARQQLADIFEGRIARAVTARVEAIIAALDDASVFGYLDDTGAPHESPKSGYFIEVDEMTRIARETTS